MVQTTVVIKILHFASLSLGWLWSKSLYATFIGKELLLAVGLTLLHGLLKQRADDDRTSFDLYAHAPTSFCGTGLVEERKTCELGTATMHWVGLHVNGVPICDLTSHCPLTVEAVMRIQ